MKWIAAAPTLLTLAFVAASAWIEAPLWTLAFRSDDSPVSWLSSAWLWAGVLLCLRLASDGSIPRVLAAWLVAGFAWMALDEQFMLHEQWLYECPAWTPLCRFGFVRHAPMLGVTFFGALTLAWLVTVLPQRQVRACLVAGVTVGIIAIVINLFPPLTPLLVMQEPLETLAEAMFLGGLLVVPTRHGAGFESSGHRS
jgi:hypothetical protein